MHNHLSLEGEDTVLSWFVKVFDQKVEYVGEVLGVVLVVYCAIVEQREVKPQRNLDDRSKYSQQLDISLKPRSFQLSKYLNISLFN